jgi:hypothetical protein
VRFNISACFLSSVGFLSEHQSGPAEFLFSRSQGVCPSARCVFRICLQFCARTAERLGPVPTHLRFSWCSSLECSAPLLSVVSPNASFDFSVWGWSAPGVGDRSAARKSVHPEFHFALPHFSVPARPDHSQQLHPGQPSHQCSASVDRAKVVAFGVFASLSHGP